MPEKTNVTKFGRRSRNAIDKKILELLTKGDNGECKQIAIMYGAYMSYAQLNQYSERLTQTGIVKIEKRDDATYWQITEKGLAYLRLLAAQEAMEVPQAS